MTGPPEGTYWVLPGRLLAGSYPGGRSVAATAERLASLTAAGVNYYIDLTQAGERQPYEPLLPGPYDLQSSRPVFYSRRPITDHGVPARPEQAVEIIDEIDEAVAAGHCVYVHCRAGIGRTGLVVGCYLARKLGDGEAALARLAQLWHESQRDRDYPHSPQTESQFEYVRQWPGVDRPRAAPPALVDPTDASVLDVALRLQDRYRGAWLGLALGDALGQPAQHRRPGTFTPIADLIGGGPHLLPPGAWTDDTAVPLILAEGVLAAGAVDPADLVSRLRAWQLEGHRSATGQCLGITAATARALAQAQWSGKAFAGSHDPARDEQEPLVRAAVGISFALPDWDRGVAIAVDCARLTHQAPVVLDAVRYAAALLYGALRGATRDELLAAPYSPVPGAWDRQPLRPEVLQAITGAGRTEPPAATGRALDALRCALEALDAGLAFRDTVLRAANFGGEADATAALTGLWAGALYGAAALPAGWRSTLVQRDLVQSTADRLLAAAIEGP